MSDNGAFVSMFQLLGKLRARSGASNVRVKLGSDYRSIILEFSWPAELGQADAQLEMTKELLEGAGIDLVDLVIHELPRIRRLRLD